MLVVTTVLLAIALVVLVWQLFATHSRLNDLATALREHVPYLVDYQPRLFAATWRSTASAANELIAALHAAEAERSSQVSQLEATLGSLQEGVIGVDESNRIILANRAVTTIFPQAAVGIGQRIETVAHSSAFSAFLDEVRHGAANSRVEIPFTTASGSIWIEATGAVVTAWNGSKSNWILCVLHDITRQKRLEAMRKEFVANVSHELRTPLSVIKGFIETLVDGHTTIPENDRVRFLRTIQRHADRLHIILEDLLTLSRLESSNPGLLTEPLELNRLLRELADDYNQRITATSHHLILELASDLPIVYADSVRLRQVFDNLLDNALKYTPQQSTIRLRTTANPQEIEIFMTDNGPGIPAHDLPHIFERFYRVDKGRSREKGGTGLGLSIVKHIILLHGGRVWAESPGGQGTTIALTLPIRKIPPLALSGTLGK